MEDTLISFETAKLAKEKGFDWIDKNNTQYYYRHDSKKQIIKVGVKLLKLWIGDMNESEVLLAPTQSLLQKWLRETYNIIITVASIFTDETHTKIRYWWWIQGHEDDENEEEIYFETYELSLESALKEALNLLKP